MAMKPSSRLSTCCITKNNYPEFKRALMEMTMGQYGEAGKAIRCGTPPCLPSFANYPTVNDVQVGNNNSLVYARESETPLANTAVNLAFPLSPVVIQISAKIKLLMQKKW